MMQFESMCLRDTWRYVMNRRPQIQPNEGFRLQLANFEVELCGSSSVAQKGFKGASKWWTFYEWNRRKMEVAW